MRHRFHVAVRYGQRFVLLIFGFSCAVNDKSRPPLCSSERLSRPSQADSVRDVTSREFSPLRYDRAEELVKVAGVSHDTIACNYPRPSNGRGQIRKRIGGNRDRVDRLIRMLVDSGELSHVRTDRLANGHETEVYRCC